MANGPAKEISPMHRIFEALYSFGLTKRTDRAGTSAGSHRSATM